MGKVLLILALVALLIWIIPTVIVLAWNASIPAIFGLMVITWKQAFGLWILAGALFGGRHYSAKKS